MTNKLTTSSKKIASLGLKKTESGDYEYINQAEKEKSKYKSFNWKGFSGKTLEMRKAQEQSYNRWDAALNEIYNGLKAQLSSSHMKKLQSEEIEWMSNRDAKAKAAALEFKGGTIEPLIYVGSLTETTKKRCYELVEKYIR